MKLGLLGLVLVPCLAQASYVCERTTGVPLALTVDESVSPVSVSYGHAKFLAELSKSETGVYGEKVFDLTGDSKREGDVVAGTLTITQVPKLGGGFCGRRFCPPDEEPEHLTISASLLMNGGEPVEFSCDQTSPLSAAALGMFGSCYVSLGGIAHGRQRAGC